MTAAGVLAACGLLVAALALSACESSADRSAKIAAQGNHLIKNQGDLKLVPTKDLVVQDAVLVRGDGVAAAAVKVVNRTGKTQRNVPVIVNVKDAQGASVYSNAAVGLQPALQRLAVLGPHQTAWWVNDQVLGGDEAKTIKAQVGAATVAGAGTVPDVKVSSSGFQTDASGPYLAGTLVNRGTAALKQVLVFAVALSGAKVVAAGRALVPSVPAGTAGKPTRFRIVFVGHDPRAAKVKLTIAPAGVA